MAPQHQQGDWRQFCSVLASSWPWAAEYGCWPGGGSVQAGSCLPGCLWLSTSSSSAQQHPQHLWRPQDHFSMVCLPVHDCFPSQELSRQGKPSKGYTKLWSAREMVSFWLGTCHLSQGYAFGPVSMLCGAYHGPAPQARRDVVSRWLHPQGCPSKITSCYNFPTHQEADGSLNPGEVLVLGWQRPLPHGRQGSAASPRGARNT